MKKLAIGCGLLLLIVAIAASVGGYLMVRKVKSTVASFAELSSVADLERQVRTRTPFEPPASGELTSTQVERLAAVQQKVRTRLGSAFADIERKYRTLLQKEDATALDAPALIAAYSDLARAYLDAKRAQVEALNEASLSLEEYRWVRNQVYAALGVPIMTLDFAKIAEAAQAGAPLDMPSTMGGAVGPSGPERNRQLVERLKKVFEENAALSVVGL